MTKKEETLFQARLERHLDELRWLYMELYGNDSMFAELCGSLRRFAEERPDSLKERDLEREADPEWYKSNDLTGMMLYIDNFAGDLNRVRKKLPPEGSGPIPANAPVRPSPAPWRSGGS